LKERINELKKQNLIYDDEREDNVNISAPIDAERCFTCEEPENRWSKRKWAAMMRFKNIIIRRLLTIRNKKLPNIKEMIVKLKAMVFAQDTMEDLDLFRKIARGDVSPDAINCHGILKNEEMMNPLLTQFGASICKLKEVVCEQETEMREIEESTKSNSESISELYGEVMDLKKRLNYFLSNK
jgi:hypothetical protein